MATAEIRLIVDPQTKKKNIHVSYQGDNDSLPMEHESDHKNIVDQLIEGGLLSAEEAGDIVVEREREENPVSIENDNQQERESIGQES